MPNKRYISGRNFEYKVKQELEKLGWYVIRSAGSKSLFDLIGINIKRIENELNSFKFQIHISFWQLKKNISDNQALKILDNILETLFNTNLVGHFQAYSFKNFKEISKICCIENENENLKQNVIVSFGVIYTPSEKLTKKQNGV